MPKPVNKIVTNRRSPKNEQDYIHAYQKILPQRERMD